MFEIIKETKKALFISKEGKACWIQKRWMREDGSLTPSGQKAFENAKLLTEIQKDFNEKQEELKKPYTTQMSPTWQSDKALRYDGKIVYYEYVGDPAYYKDFSVFLPKNQLKNNEIPEWLVAAKFTEAKKLADSAKKYKHDFYFFSIDFLEDYKNRHGL